jgi:hypothetical protein
MPRGNRSQMQHICVDCSEPETFCEKDSNGDWVCPSCIIRRNETELRQRSKDRAGSVDRKDIDRMMRTNGDERQPLDR